MIRKSKIYKKISNSSPVKKITKFINDVPILKNFTNGIFSFITSEPVKKSYNTFNNIFRDFGSFLSPKKNKNVIKKINTKNTGHKQTQIKLKKQPFFQLMEKLIILASKAIYNPKKNKNNLKNKKITKKSQKTKPYKKVKIKKPYKKPVVKRPTKIYKFNLKNKIKKFVKKSKIIKKVFNMFRLRR